MPVVTRLYEVIEIGYASAFLGASILFYSLATLNYPMAIVLAKSYREECNLIALTYLWVLLISVPMTVLFYSVNQFTNIGFPEFYLLFIPIALLIRASYEVCSYSLIKREKFDASAKSTLFASLSSNTWKVSLGVLYPKGVFIILSSLISELVFSYCSLKYGKLKQLNLIFLRYFKLRCSFRELRATAIKYKSYPLYRTSQALMFAIGEAAPILYIASVYGAKATGYYGLARSILEVPSSALGNSITQVLFPHLNKLNNVKEQLKTAYKFSLFLILAGCAAFILLNEVGTSLFSYVFGADWTISGVYATYLSIGVFAVLASKPIISLIPIIRYEKFFFKFEIYNTLSKLTMLIVLFWIEASIVSFILLLSILILLNYIVLNAFITIYSLNNYNRKY